MNSRSLLGRSAASLISFSRATTATTTTAFVNKYWFTSSFCAGRTPAAGTTSLHIQAHEFGASPRAARLYSLPLKHAHTSHVTAMSAVSENQQMAGAIEDPTPTKPSTPIGENLESVRKRIEDVAQKVREGQPVPRLVAVSKTKPVEDLKTAYDAGQRVFGENYAQELIDKSPQMPDDVVWHFIGHLQSKKAKALVAGVPNLEVVETLDTTKLADKLQAACEAAERTRPLGVFLQIDTSGEDAKSGVYRSDLDTCLSLATHVNSSCPLLALKGVMTIGAPGDMDCFDRLSACRDAIAGGIGVEPQALELSMGMSGDFEEAIRRGSTNVRVGSTIFGARNYANK